MVLVARVRMVGAVGVTDNAYACPRHSETEASSRLEPNAIAPKEIPPVQSQQQEGQGVIPQALPNALKDDLARRRAYSGPPPQRENLSAFMQASITQSDLEKWERLKMTIETRCLHVSLCVCAENLLL